MAKTDSIKKERFRVVASRRVQKLLDDFDSLSKCANRSTYEYSEEDVRKMLKAVNDKVAVLKASFTAGTKSAKESFQF